MAKIQNPDLPIDALRARYAYEPESGALTSKRTGKQITANNGRGYLRVALGAGQIRMRVHRLAWALHYGAWPTAALDHRNRDRGDNRIENLRLAQPSENSRNRATTARSCYLSVRIAPNGRFYGVLRALDGRTVQTPRRATAFDSAVDAAEAGIFFHSRSAFTYAPDVAAAACSRNGFDLELLRLFDFDHQLWRWAK